MLRDKNRFIQNFIAMIKEAWNPNLQYHFWWTFSSSWDATLTCLVSFQPATRMRLAEDSHVSASRRSEDGIQNFLERLTQDEVGLSDLPYSRFWFKLHNQISVSQNCGLWVGCIYWLQTWHIRCMKEIFFVNLWNRYGLKWQVQTSQTPWHFQFQLVNQ